MRCLWIYLLDLFKLFFPDLDESDKTFEEGEKTGWWNPPSKK